MASLAEVTSWKPAGYPSVPWMSALGEFAPAAAAAVGRRWFRSSVTQIVRINPRLRGQAGHITYVLMIRTRLRAKTMAPMMMVAMKMTME